jgi:magnesium transporter
MVRALATGDVRLSDWGKLLGRELFVGGMLGATMALAVLPIGALRGGPEVAAVVALTMLLIVIVGSTIGLSLPFILSKFKLDPAAASAPLITSLSDISGVLIYFSLATWLLNLPS